MTKTCPKCQRNLDISLFWKNKSRKNGYNSYCKKCVDKYRTDNLRKRAEQSTLRRRKLREKIIQHYGGKCQCCGETEYKFLSFDHIEGGGNKHKKIVGRSEKFLRWIMNNNYPDILQILCHNCNQAKGAWGKCPHEEMAS